MRKMNVIKPSYYDDFQCIGGDCRQNCCSCNWTIDITKQEFKQIKRALQSETLKKIFATAFIVEEGKSFQKTDSYKMKLTQNGSCPFLDEKGLCLIYQDCGPEVMSKVCRLFPRFNFIYYNEKINRCLSLGCEEVVRLVLQQKEGIVFVSEEENISDEEIKETTKIDVVRAVVPILDYFYDITSFVFDVLQNRSYEIGERMVLLGMAFQNIDKLEKDKKIEQIPQYMQSFIQNMDKPEYREIYENFFEKVNKSGRIRAMNTLNTYHSIIKKQSDNDITERICKRINAEMRLGASEQQKKGEDTVVIDQVKYHFDGEKYDEAEKQFQKWLEENSYILENIMVCLAWHINIAFIPSGGVWKKYCVLAAIYSIYRFDLAMLITENTTQEQLIEDIVKISRSTLHSYEYTKKLEKELEENQSNTLAHMAVLVL